MHLFRDSQDAWQARHEAHRRGTERSPRAGGRRRGELNIVAQDTTYYGLDLYGRTRLAELLAELDKIEGLDWIRVMYLYPMYFTDDLIDVLAKAKRIVPYLDMPLQHINDTMSPHAKARESARDRNAAHEAVASGSRTW